jgi:hypothetical protein
MQGLGRGFSVDDVLPASTPALTESLTKHVVKRFRRQVLAIPEAEKPVINSMAAVEHYINRCHPLIDAVGTAFSQHRPLILSPDSIWLVIEQGFAHHVAENAETLRHRLVRHQGSRELMTGLRELSLQGFERAISNISDQICAATDPVLHETLICDFSTTTPAVRTASEVVLMDCYSSYFTYNMMAVCGIPKITLLGSLDDWKRIRARIEVIETFGLEWWIARVRPILDEFVRTAAGNPDQKFWQAIYKPRQAYGTETVTGWIADLFPYLGDSPERSRNHVFQHERHEWAIPVKSGVKTAWGQEPGAEKGVPPKSFPSGLSSVPVKLSSPAGSSIGIDLVAGFFAVEQNPDDLALSPVISWAGTEPKPEKPVTVWG